VDELMWLRLSGQLAPSGIDVAGVIGFVTFGVLYFLAPVVGYLDRPVGMLAAMYLMAATVGVMVLQTIFSWSQIISGPGARPMATGELSAHLLFVFMLVKLGLILASMLAFIGGLRGLRRRPARPEHPDYGIGN
jgi:hypothetical protein